MKSIPDLSDSEVRSRYSASAIRIFVAIMKAWNVSDEDARMLLGGISADSYEAMKSKKYAENLDEDQLLRVSYLIGAYKALRILHSDRLALTWMSRPNSNKIFGGITPLEYCRREGTPGFAIVRKLLDARCQGT